MFKGLGVLFRVQGFVLYPPKWLTCSIMVGLHKPQKVKGYLLSC